MIDEHLMDAAQDTVIILSFGLAAGFALWVGWCAIRAFRAELRRRRTQRWRTMIGSRYWRGPWMPKDYK